MFLRTVVFIVTLAGSGLLTAAVEDDIKLRLAPIGQLCMAGDACAAAVVTVAAGPRSGEEVYTSKCIACHGSGAAGAPKLGDTAGWSARIGKGMETLYDNALNGFRGMPAKGLCMDCSDEEIAATVDYMVENSQ
ncbi:MAG: c-type cytochrome [Cellvibrionaceae bacterium]|nr:c-type cytochrome [Cellvibrionaceae bacterium]